MSYVLTLSSSGVLVLCLYSYVLTARTVGLLKTGCSLVRETCVCTDIQHCDDYLSAYQHIYATRRLEADGASNSVL